MKLFFPFLSEFLMQVDIVLNFLLLVVEFEDGK